VVLEQIRADAAALDGQSLAIGPFARLDAGAVAAREGKTRGAVYNLFGRELDEGTTITDPATAAAALIEGAWLNQCLTAAHPARPAEPAAEALRRSGRLLWRGATHAG
jgi:hypothetical protein